MGRTQDPNIRQLQRRIGDGFKDIFCPFCGQELQVGKKQRSASGAWGYTYKCSNEKCEKKPHGFAEVPWYQAIAKSLQNKSVQLTVAALASITVASLIGFGTGVIGFAHDQQSTLDGVKTGLHIQKIRVEAEDTLFAPCVIGVPGKEVVDRTKAILLKPKERLIFVSGVATRWTVNPRETLRSTLPLLKQFSYTCEDKLEKIFGDIATSTLAAVGPGKRANNSDIEDKFIRPIRRWIDSGFEAGSRPNEVLDQGYRIFPVLTCEEISIINSIKGVAEYIARNEIRENWQEGKVIQASVDFKDNAAVKFWSHLIEKLVWNKEHENLHLRVLWYTPIDSSGLASGNRYPCPEAKSGQLIAALLTEHQVIAGGMLAPLDVSSHKGPESPGCDSPFAKVVPFSTHGDSIVNTENKPMYVRFVINDDRPRDNGSGFANVQFVRHGPGSSTEIALELD